MTTREELKKEIDEMPEYLLEEAYMLLKKLSQRKQPNVKKITVRDFHGKLDSVNVRNSAYE